MSEEEKEQGTATETTESPEDAGHIASHTELTAEETAAAAEVQGEPAAAEEAAAPQESEQGEGAAAEGGEATEEGAPAAATEEAGESAAADSSEAAAPQEGEEQPAAEGSGGEEAAGEAAAEGEPAPASEGDAAPPADPQPEEAAKSEEAAAPAEGEAAAEPAAAPAAEGEVAAEAKDEESAAPATPPPEAAPQEASTTAAGGDEAAAAAGEQAATAEGEARPSSSASKTAAAQGEEEQPQPQQQKSGSSHSSALKAELSQPRVSSISREGSAKGEAPPAQEQRPVSSGGGANGFAAQAEAAAQSKAQAAEASGYVAPGLRLIDVEVAQGPGLPNRLLRVLMDYTQADPKPYLGGNRNKHTSTVFHHAVTQTPKAPRYLGAEPKLERTTQTVRVKHHTAQTIREAATQMERPGFVLDNTNDVERIPGRYQTSQEWMAIVDKAVRTMQRWTRGWMGRKRAAYLQKTKQQREAFLQEEEAKAQAAAEKHRQTEINRRMHPRTAADFEILYNELEAWRLQETHKIINASLPKEKEQLLLQQLLHKETKLLQTIDRLKINANHENKDLRIQRTLGEMSKPKTYELRNGAKVEVHTPFTTRAKELMQLYNGLNLPMLTVDERLDVLLHVKWTVKEFDCNLTREIVELVDREADLLNRGRSTKMLEGLRKRISSLFLSFLETPEFNPESAQFQVVPMDFEQYMYDKLEKATAKSPESKGSKTASITRS